MVQEKLSNMYSVKRLRDGSQVGPDSDPGGSVNRVCSIIKDNHKWKQ